MESIDKLRKMDDDELVALGNGQYGRDYRHGRIADEIEREIAELQESWAQEAREHADDSARLAELAHENAELKREIAELRREGTPKLLRNYSEGGGRMSVITNESTKAAIDDWMAVKDGRKSRWHKLFGTPERAAQTLAKVCDECDDNFPCWECPLSPIIGSNVYEPELLEWLRGDA